MNSNNKKYLEEKNSDELSQRFHEKAGEISKDLNRQLLSLSTGIIGAFFILAFNKTGLTIEIKILILISIFCFGSSIYFIIIGMQNDSSKNYFLGHINDSTKQEKREEYEEFKKNYNSKQLKNKKTSRIFFLFGIITSIIIMTFYLFEINLI